MACTGLTTDNLILSGKHANQYTWVSQAGPKKTKPFERKMAYEEWVLKFHFGVFLFLFFNLQRTLQAYFQFFPQPLRLDTFLK